MITAVVIGVSLALIAAFLAAWIARPRLRSQIEHPKHWFLDRVRQYDLQCSQQPGRSKANSDESD